MWLKPYHVENYLYPSAEVDGNNQNTKQVFIAVHFSERILIKLINEGF